MKAFLMFRDRDSDLQGQLPWNQAALIQDLELNTLVNAMAQGDAFLLDVAGKALLTSLTDLETILYRQNILKDCLKNAALIRDIYALAVEAITNEKKAYWGAFSKYPPAILDRAITVLQLFVGQLKRLRTIANEQASRFESEGFTRLFAMLQAELSDEYFLVIEDHLRELKFRRGVLISAELGTGHKGVNYVLRKANGQKQPWRERVFGKKPPVYSFRIDDRDEAGARALSELKDRGIHLAANALAQSCDHILSFFTMLRTELAFYIGCLNLQEQLAQLSEPLAFPVPAMLDERCHTYSELYDVCLALNMKQKIVGNTGTADGKHLVIITGANQGGKSTFLRSIGLAQLMMQCGMQVPAESFCANVCDGLFTHYKREEDTSMKSGKLDEELSRMSTIVDHLTPNALVLFNESFAATNEREGSEIARQIISALIEKQHKVFYVTHLYDFAHSVYNRKLPDAIFLRAERQLDGERTFKVTEGEPLQTSFGEDLYVKIFGATS